MSFPYPMNPYDQQRADAQSLFNEGAISRATYLDTLAAIDAEEIANEQAAAWDAAQRMENEALWAEEDDET